MSGCCNKVKGALRLLQSEAGVGITDAGRIGERRAICESCDQWEHGRCLKCGCYTFAKTRLTNERCPIGKW